MTNRSSRPQKKKIVAHLCFLPAKVQRTRTRAHIDFLSQIGLEPRSSACCCGPTKHNEAAHRRRPWAAATTNGDAPMEKETDQGRREEMTQRHTKIPDFTQQTALSQSWRRSSSTHFLSRYRDTTHTSEVVSEAMAAIQQNKSLPFLLLLLITAAGVTGGGAPYIIKSTCARAKIHVAHSVPVLHLHTSRPTRRPRPLETRVGSPSRRPASPPPT
jgi:hypothetical protein